LPAPLPHPSRERLPKSVREAATDVRRITYALASLAIALIAFAPRVATTRTAAPATSAPTPSLARSSSATTVAPVPSPSASAAAVSGSEVRIVEPAIRPPQEWTYSPDQVSVKMGTRVVWTNSGAVAHTVTADDGTSFDSGSIDPKTSFALTATAAGTFAYHCTFHPWMKGTLVVTL
jgi:plastocyanin